MSVKTQKADDRSSTDRIENRVELRAPRSRVWRAITTAREFAAWFRVDLEGEFAEGRTIRAKHGQMTFDLLIERMEPERYFSYRWHPYPADPAVDYSAEPTTLVEFILEEIAGGTAVTIVESGFDRIPMGRRAEAFRQDSRGWTKQIENLERYVS